MPRGKEVVVDTLTMMTILVPVLFLLYVEVKGPSTFKRLEWWAAIFVRCFYMAIGALALWIALNNPRPWGTVERSPFFLTASVVLMVLMFVVACGMDYQGQLTTSAEASWKRSFRDRFRYGAVGAIWLLIFG